MLPFSPLEAACDLLRDAQKVKDDARTAALKAHDDGHDDGPFIEFANNLDDAMSDLIGQAEKMEEYAAAERESRAQQQRIDAKAA